MFKETYPLLTHKKKKVIQPIEQGYDVGTLVTCMEESQQQNRTAKPSSQHLRQALFTDVTGFADVSHGCHHLGVYAYRKTLWVYLPQYTHTHLSVQRV